MIVLLRGGYDEPPAVDRRNPGRHRRRHGRLFMVVDDAVTGSRSDPCLHEIKKKCKLAWREGERTLVFSLRIHPMYPYSNPFTRMIWPTANTEFFCVTLERHDQHLEHNLALIW